MQHLCMLVLLPRQTFILLLHTCQGQVRFFALHRIKPHTPPLVQAPVNFFYSKYAPFTARTTRVSNPVCSPSFRASVSGIVQGLAFATGVPLDIYAFHCYTENSSPPSNPRAE